MKQVGRVVGGILAFDAAFLGLLWYVDFEPLTSCPPELEPCSGVEMMGNVLFLFVFLPLTYVLACVVLGVFAACTRREARLSTVLLRVLVGVALHMALAIACATAFGLVATYATERATDVVSPILGWSFLLASLLVTPLYATWPQPAVQPADPAVGALADRSLAIS